MNRPIGLHTKTNEICWRQLFKCFALTLKVLRIALLVCKAANVAIYWQCCYEHHKTTFTIYVNHLWFNNFNT